MTTRGGEVMLWDLLGRVPDHRSRLGRRFELRSMLGLSLAAVLAGRDSVAAIARWGRKLKEEDLRRFEIRRGRAPCQATYHYVFVALNVERLERILGRWVRGTGAGKGLGQVSMDGKVARGSRCGEYAGVCVLAAYCEAIRGVAAQRGLPKGKNEIDTAMMVLKEIPLRGAVVTGDAIYCQKKICRAIVKGGGDYLFAVKDNQRQLREDIEAAFSEPVSPLGSEATAGRGRAGERG